jgi:hypothetical protein
MCPFDKAPFISHYLDWRYPIWFERRIMGSRDITQEQKRMLAKILPARNRVFRISQVSPKNSEAMFWMMAILQKFQQSRAKGQQRWNGYPGYRIVWEEGGPVCWVGGEEEGSH